MQLNLHFDRDIFCLHMKGFALKMSFGDICIGVVCPFSLVCETQICMRTTMPVMDLLTVLHSSTLSRASVGCCPQYSDAHAAGLRVRLHTAGAGRPSRGQPAGARDPAGHGADGQAAAAAAARLCRCAAAGVAGCLMSCALAILRLLCCAGGVPSCQH